MSMYEQEALAILFALQSFHCYLYDTEFMLCTDYKPLNYFKTIKIIHALHVGFLK